ncbi:MAG: low molecular weight phosphotyrosine protein phosphatase [Clostridia bacterium]|nr:low molecular weight phosphotyrosine protein phosphatase [Clostridia bacterium]
MTKIMFVCHGNICRSPMAEFVMKDLVKKAGREGAFHIASSATSTEEIWNGVGNPVYPPAKRELAAHGLSCEGKRAVQIKKSDYDLWDMIICMDSKNLRNLHRIFGGDPERKINKLMSFAGKDRDVSDPWYTGDFEGVYNDILEGCTELLKNL